MAQTGSVFNRRHALISAISFGEADWASHRFRLSLTKEEVKNSLDHDRPVSRQRER